jgi:hypothetical protein
MSETATQHGQAIQHSVGVSRVPIAGEPWTRPVFAVSEIVKRLEWFIASYSAPE